MSLNILFKPFGCGLRPWELSESYWRAAFRFCCNYNCAASWLVAPYLLLYFTCLLRTDIGGAPLPEIWFKGRYILLLIGSLFKATGDVYCCS